MYFDHRGENGTHGVFLASSQGMDIKIDDTDGQFLEYNTIGGVVDLYFLAGPTPKEVAVQYSALSGTAAMMPYWVCSLVLYIVQLCRLTRSRVSGSTNVNTGTVMYGRSRKL